MKLQIKTCQACTGTEGIKMNLVEIVKSYAKDDADFSNLDEQLGAFTNLSELTKDNFTDTLKKVPSAISAFDSINRSNVEAGVNNFKTGKMVDDWKEKEAGIRAEINPKETQDQKTIRELTEWKQESINGQKLSMKKDALALEAKGLEFDSDIARKMAMLNDDAIPLIKDIIAWKDALLSGHIKQQYNQGPPKRSVDFNQLTTLSDSELYEAATNNPSQKVAILNEIKRRTIP